MKTIVNAKILQARIYFNQDNLLPEDQWAQITVKMDLQNVDGENVT